jgi:hypothetical protein
MGQSISIPEEHLPVCSEPATFVGYSEWRPTRYSVVDSSSRNYGLFTSYAKAETFANGVLMSLEEEGAYVSIRPVRGTNFYVWCGDNIGCGNGPASVLLSNDFGSQSSHSVRRIFELAPMIDAYGFSRVVSALRLMADLGELHPEDLSAWREVEDEFPVFQRGEVL